MNQQKKEIVAISLTPKARKLLARLAKERGLSRSALLELWIREEAEAAKAQA